MSTRLSLVPPPEHRGPAEDLRYIRSTMERASAFTAVPGVGGMLMGVVGLAAAALAGPPDRFVHWITVWLAGAAVAAPIGAAGILRKGRATGVGIGSAPGRRFLLAFAPPLLAGAVLTVALARAGAIHLIPSTWLLLYGAALLAAGAQTVRPVALLGAATFGLGLVALVLPHAAVNGVLALAFGVMHIVCGWIIARRHGG